MSVWLLQLWLTVRDIRDIRTVRDIINFLNFVDVSIEVQIRQQQALSLSQLCHIGLHDLSHRG